MWVFFIPFLLSGLLCLIFGMNVALFRRRYEPTIHKYDYYKHPKITISPLRLHAASSVRIPTATHSFRTLLPTIRMRPLNLFSTSSVDLQGASNTNILLIKLRVRLTPIKSSVLRKYPNRFIRLGMYARNFKVPRVATVVNIYVPRLLYLHLSMVELLQS